MDISNNDTASSPAATGARRKSGRAVRAPEKFIPNVPSSQPAPANTKRKRPAEEAEIDASEVEEEDEESDSAIESAGEEELKESRRKAKSSRKPAAKKPKVNGAVRPNSPPAVRLPSRPKKAKKVAIADKSAEGLYGKYSSMRRSHNADYHYS